MRSKAASIQVTGSLRARLYCLDPLILFSICMVAINDHVLKGSALAGWWTGKLSDLFGFFCFPFFLLDLVSLTGPRGRKTFLTLLVATGIAFTLLKLSPLVLSWYRAICAAVGTLNKKTPQSRGFLILSYDGHWF
jgi:hypothetical protein